MNALQIAYYQVVPYVVLPDGAATQPPGTNGFTTLMGWLKWVLLVLCLAMLLIAFAQNSRSNKRGEASEAPEWVGRVMVSVIGITGGGAMLGFLLTANAA